MDRDVTTNVIEKFLRVRETTVRLCDTLTAEDTVVQSMPDTSPTKWHLAHITWFFEHFVLDEYAPDYQRFNDDFNFLFNSYYYSVGQMHARPRRGLLSRPTLAEVFAYREHVDNAMQRLLEQRDDKEIMERVVLGINHEQQHQELLLTDIKHVLSCNPLSPAMNPELRTAASAAVGGYEYRGGQSGIRPIGASGLGFCFDNETPRHDALLQEHEIGTRLVTNGEFREFIADGAYSNSALWLSDGWAVVNECAWQRPLYWSADLASEFTLGGMREIDENAPVCHVSYYEADAFARWAGARLPTEFEWEDSAAEQAIDGNLMESKFWQPVAIAPVGGPSGPKPFAAKAAPTSQLFGDVWEWTSSAYSAYPGFTPLAGSLGEYNGKFMCNQMSVRGGSCVTAADHLRASYRSFFYPDARWQFLGIRLARDGAV